MNELADVPPSRNSTQASVVTVNPGGTASPMLLISARDAPFLPSCSTGGGRTIMSEVTQHGSEEGCAVPTALPAWSSQDRGRCATNFRGLQTMIPSAQGGRDCGSRCCVSALIQDCQHLSRGPPRAQASYMHACWSNESSPFCSESQYVQLCSPEHVLKAQCGIRPGAYPESQIALQRTLDGTYGPASPSNNTLAPVNILNAPRHVETCPPQRAPEAPFRRSPLACDLRQRLNAINAHDSQFCVFSVAGDQSTPNVTTLDRRNTRTPNSTTPFPQLH